mmetsp:Transcript_30010/g.82333  ORF Transcript_30010/g.82333 Transcript_30010/m.82333 type:complete len:223 (-) Transcript_30010:97-765(-)
MHCTDSMAWREAVDKEWRIEHGRPKDGQETDVQFRGQVNPYGTQQAYFKRGQAHLFNNDSSKTRMVLAPHTIDPLRTRQVPVVEKGSVTLAGSTHGTLRSQQQQSRPADGEFKARRSVTIRSRPPSESACSSLSRTVTPRSARSEASGFSAFSGDRVYNGADEGRLGSARTVFPIGEETLQADELADEFGFSGAPNTARRRDTRDREASSKVSNYGKMLVMR